MLLTLDGIVTDSSDVQPSKANQSMRVIPLVITTLFSLLEENALSAIPVILYPSMADGITM